MDDDDLKRDIEAPLMGDDNPPYSAPQDTAPQDDIGDPIDRELEEEINLTNPVLDPNLDSPEGANGATEAGEPSDAAGYDPSGDTA